MDALQNMVITMFPIYLHKDVEANKCVAKVLLFQVQILTDELW